MDKAIAIIDMPETCGECLFCSAITEMYLGNGFYKKFGKCVLAKDIEDPWRNVYWQSEHKEEWCPLKPVPEKIDIPDFDDTIKAKSDNACEVGMYMYDRGHHRGYNACIEKILNN